MDSNKSGINFLKTMYSLGQLNLTEKLNTMNKSELLTISIILKSKDGGIRVCDIAKAQNISTPAVSRTLSRLEQKEYIKRIIDKSDRRNTYIEVTDRGKSAFYSDIHTVGDFMDNSLKHLSDEDVEKLVVLMKKLHHGMDSELSKIDNRKILYEKDTANNE